MTAIALEAEHFQPMRMGLASQQLCGTLPLALRAFAAEESPVIQEEAEEKQIVRADMSTQEEVRSQTTVDVFNDRAGTNDS